MLKKKIILIATTKYLFNAVTLKPHVQVVMLLLVWTKSRPYDNKLGISIKTINCIFTYCKNVTVKNKFLLILPSHKMKVIKMKSHQWPLEREIKKCPSDCRLLVCITKDQTHGKKQHNSVFIDAIPSGLLLLPPMEKDQAGLGVSPCGAQDRPHDTPLINTPTAGLGFS